MSLLPSFPLNYCGHLGFKVHSLSKQSPGKQSLRNGVSVNQVAQSVEKAFGWPAGTRVQIQFSSRGEGFSRYTFIFSISDMHYFCRQKFFLNGICFRQFYKNAYRNGRKWKIFSQNVASKEYRKRFSFSSLLFKVLSKFHT